jgi:hypothetical protein
VPTVGTEDADEFVEVGANLVVFFDAELGQFPESLVFAHGGTGEAEIGAGKYLDEQRWSGFR